MTETTKVTEGDTIPPWIMPCVAPERMRTMAAILRDPNPIHWDPDSVDAMPLGFGKRTINQGPLGLSYIINMLHAWAGVDCIRRIVMRFPQVVLDNERVVAHGTVIALRQTEKVTDSATESRTEHLAQCDIWLEEAKRGVLLEGTATIALPPAMR